MMQLADIHEKHFDEMLRLAWDCFVLLCPRKESRGCGFQIPYQVWGKLSSEYGRFDWVLYSYKRKSICTFTE
jgi:hypothetical protein